MSSKRAACYCVLCSPRGADWWLFIAARLTRCHLQTTSARRRRCCRYCNTHVLSLYYPRRRLLRSCWFCRAIHAQPRLLLSCGVCPSRLCIVSRWPKSSTCYGMQIWPYVSFRMISRSRNYLTLDISETVRHRDNRNGGIPTGIYRCRIQGWHFEWPSVT